MSSNAVAQGWVSRIIGYVLQKGNFASVSPNLPQSIAILAEANDANQATLDLTPTQITSAQQAGKLYGYGSPIYAIARILFPIISSGSGVQNIPVMVYPQAKAAGATKQVYSITASGVANNNGTHYLVVAGRENLDGQSYAINVNIGDTAADIASKINDAINGVLGCPFIATDTDYATTLTSKWSGLTASGLTLSVDTGSDDLGLTYTVNEESAGSGVPDVSAALALFGNRWNTIVINSYGTDADTMDALEEFNGIPDPENPTGRFVGITMKPFVALTGSVLEDPSTITNSRKNNVTIAICPAPLSAALPMEAAANMAVLFAVLAQNSPALDVGGLSYPDMPASSMIGAMSDPTNRNNIVQAGCSTVDLVNDVYVVMDFATTYHPDGEIPPQYRFVRNLYSVDMNIFYRVFLLIQQNVIGKVIANDNDVVTIPDVVKPKTFKALLFQLSEDCVSQGLMVDAAFTQNSLDVTIDAQNPDRFDTNFKYKRSGVARVVSTTATAGFNFGTLI